MEIGALGYYEFILSLSNEPSFLPFKCYSNRRTSSQTWSVEKGGMECKQREKSGAGREQEEKGHLAHHPTSLNPVSSGQGMSKRDTGEEGCFSFLSHSSTKFHNFFGRDMLEKKANRRKHPHRERLA